MGKNSQYRITINHEGVLEMSDLMQFHLPSLYGLVDYFSF